MSEPFTLDFEPLGRRGPCAADTTLLEAARRLGVALINDCGGSGVCGHCRVQIMAGSVSPLTMAEEALLYPAETDAGYRLACAAYPRSDCKVHVPAESLSRPMTAQVAGQERAPALQPPLLALQVELAPPTLAAPQADADNLLAALAAQGHTAVALDLPLLRALPGRLRAQGWRGTAVLRDGEAIAFLPPDTAVFGLAVDLGSTGIAAYLVALDSGDTAAARGVMNPQISYGEDIVSRITYALKSPAAAQTLQRVVIELLNELAGDLCAEAGIAREQVLELVIAGNTAMQHLLLGLPARELVRAPFIPAAALPLQLKARELGLDLAPGAALYLPPNIAGFIGSDHVAMLLATGPQPDQPTLALDIGTNTEISLLLPGQAPLSVSCASGPAFEGYHIRHGVRARAGAIEKVQVTPQGSSYQTIEHAPPNGICGSGIVDVVAQLHLAGALSDNGRLLPAAHPQIRERDGAREFVLVPAADGEQAEIVVTQDDIREVLLAKSAIQTGIQALLAEGGVGPQELMSVIIAGAFGSYIHPGNAQALGLLPPVPLERVQQVGNAAGVGAKYLLLSSGLRERAAGLQQETRYVELARYPNFARLFAQNCRLSAGYG